MRWACALAVVAACGSSKQDAPKLDKPTAEACARYARTTAELMYVGFERGSHGMAQFIKQEFVAAIATPLAPYCLEHLPKEHVTCVVATTTAADADRCLLDPAIKAAMTPVLKQLVKDASQVAELPATAAECNAAAKVIILAMQPALAENPKMRLPTPEQIAALCVGDRWTADYVRCTTVANGVDCKAKQNVKPGLTKLVQDVQGP